MAAPGLAAQPVLSERADVHKSCKSLEALVDTLNDYCEAIHTIVISQKRLVKTLREAAGSKATGEIAANTLNASASIFEAMLEINTKFGKIADQESDNINSELKRWYKKLAKEEKAHDEKLSTINTRIKHAGHLYDSKPKKSPQEVSEEHTRYINLISTLGPEITQEKRNHALLVTQKHSLVTNNVAACLSRLADIEWLRSCEEVRRFASKIGELGQWRTLCEGGWTGSIPQDLPSLNGNPEQSFVPNNPQSNSSIHLLQCQDSRKAKMWTEQSQFDECAGVRDFQDAHMPPLWTTASGEPFISRKPSTLSAQQPANSSPLNRPKTASHVAKVLSTSSEKWTDTVGSVTSLSSFPSPPAHIPDTAGSADPSSTRLRHHPLPMQLQPSSSSRSSNLPRSPVSPRTGVSEQVYSPEGLRSLRSARSDLTLQAMMSVASSHVREKDTVGLGLGSITEPNTQTSGHSNQNTKPGHTLSRSATLQPIKRNWSPLARDTPQTIEKSSSLNSDSNSTLTSPLSSKQEGACVVDDLEVGRSSGQTKPQNFVVVEEQGVEKRDSTASANSVVASIRDRYTSPTASPSKDPAQLSVSVNELPSGFTDDLSLSRPPVAPSIGERQSQSFENVSSRLSLSQEDNGRKDLPSPSPSPSTGANTEALDGLPGKQETVGEQGGNLEERASVDRQQEIEKGIREFKEDHIRPRISRDNGSRSPPNGDPGALPQATSSAPAISQTRYSYSTTQLTTQTPPPPSSFTNHSYAHPRGQAANLDHAPFCGCATCSASKYKVRSITPTPYDLRPPEPPIILRPEKSRGWIRRIAVPVGQAFSSERKSVSGLKSGSIFSSAAAGEDGRLKTSHERSGISNRSMMNVGRR